MSSSSFNEDKSSLYVASKSSGSISCSGQTVSSSKRQALIFTDAEKSEFCKSLSSKILSDIEKNYNEETDLSFTHELTDKLILQTVSVNGINDVDYVKNYIINLNVKDAKSYRDYMRDNEPGLDYNIDVERPLSLGGGSLKSFLQLDQFIFITV